MEEERQKLLNEIASGQSQEQASKYLLHKTWPFLGLLCNVPALNMSMVGLCFYCQIFL